MGLDLEEFQPIFGEAKAELEASSATSNGDVISTLNPFLFRVFAADLSHLAFHVTDFRSNTWEALRSVHQLDDMVFFYFFFFIFIIYVFVVGFF